jgi:hypothetical protein
MSSTPKKYRGLEVGDVAPYFGVVLTITFFLPKLNGSAFGEILPEVVHGKEMLSSVDADEGRYSTTLTFQMIFTTFIFHRCRISQVIQGNSGSSIRADNRRRRLSGTQKRKCS